MTNRPPEGNMVYGRAGVWDVVRVTVRMGIAQRGCRQNVPAGFGVVGMSASGGLLLSVARIRPPEE